MRAKRSTFEGGFMYMYKNLDSKYEASSLQEVNQTVYLQRPVSTAAAAQLLKLGIWVMNWMGPLPVRK